MNYLKITDASGNVYRLSMPFAVELEAIAPAVPPQMNAELVYEQDRSAGLGDVAMHMPGDASTYTVIDAPGRPGKAVRHFIPGNSPGFLEFDGKTRKHRAMLRHGVKAPKLAFVPDTEYWVGFGLYVPADYPFGDWKSSTSTGYAAFCFDWQVGMGHGEINALLVSGDLLIRRGTIDGQQENLLAYPIAKETWYDLVIHLLRDTKEPAVLQIWINGKKEVDTEWMCNDYAASGVEHPYFRTGIYWGTDVRLDPYTQIFTPVKVATGGSDGYALVAPT